MAAGPTGGHRRSLDRIDSRAWEGAFDGFRS